MHVVEALVFLSLGKIKFRAFKNLRIGRHRQAFLHFIAGERWKLREKFEASFADGLAHSAVSCVGKKCKRGRSTELLALKKQRRPWPEQKQRGHCAIAPGGGLETK